MAKTEKYRCRLCDHAITLNQKHFHMGICEICDEDIPNHIPHQQKYKYLLNKLLKKGL
jgi:hypothetical protein